MRRIGEHIDRLKDARSSRGVSPRTPRVFGAQAPRGSRTHPAAWVVVVAGLACALASCAAPPKEKERPATTRPAEQVPAIEGSRLVPVEPWSTQARITEGPGKGSTVTQRMARAGDHWTLTLEGRYRTHLRVDEDGALRVVREDDFRENVAVHYEPALLWMPATLDGSFSSHRQEVQIKVHHLAKGGQSGALRDRGTGVYQILGVTHRGGGGAGQSYTIEDRFELNLSLADADVIMRSTYAPGTGRVAWTVDRYTQALGLLSGRRVEAYRVVGQENLDAPIPDTQPATAPGSPR